jgi:hypothetical protein
MRSVPNTDEFSSVSPTLPPTAGKPPAQPSETQIVPRSTSAVETATVLPKAPLISYVIYGGDGEASSELNTCLNWTGPHERFLLYEDGQLFLYKSGSLLEAHLTQLEIQDLLSALDSTGFHEIEESIEAPDGYDTYILPDDYQYGAGGWGRRITIKGRSIHIRDSLWEFIIPSIEDTVRIIEDYEPARGAVAYVPSTLEIFVLPTESGYLSESSFQTAQEWPPELPPIDQIWFLDEKETDMLLNTGLFSSFPDIQAFKSNGIEYVVITCPSHLEP